MGKAYANKKTKEERPEGDFYSTPKSLVWVAEDIIKQEFASNNSLQPIILEPCSGMNAIADELKKLNFRVFTNDLYSGHAQTNFDYLDSNEFGSYPKVITNPPFSLWDSFVNRAKSHCNKFMFIGRLNYFGTTDRYQSGIWENLKAVYPFNRYIDYRTPYREDGLFNVGAMATGWFLWDMNYSGKPTIEVLDVQQYAKLGQYKEVNSD